MVLRSHRSSTARHRHRPPPSNHSTKHAHTHTYDDSNDWWLGRLFDRLMCDALCCYSGFLRSDTLIGTVTVKLQPLETQCEVHESFDVSMPQCD